MTERVTVGGHRVGFDRRGSGPPVLFLHGYVGDRRVWDGQLEALSGSFDALAVDLPGFGASSDPPETFGLDAFADVVAGFVDALSLEAAHVVGLSWGGGLAIEVFRRHPALVRSLVLVSAYAGWAGSLPPDVVEARLQQAIALSQKSASELVDALLPTMFARDVPDDVRDAFGASIGDFHPVGLRAASRSFARADLRDVLPRIDVPTLLVYGERDERAPVAVGEEIHRAIAASKLVVIPGAGHIVNLDAPESFNRELVSFLSAGR